VSFCPLSCCFALAPPKRQAKRCPASTCRRSCTKDRFRHDRKSDSSAREQTDPRTCVCCVYRARALRSVWADGIDQVPHAGVLERTRLGHMGQAWYDHTQGILYAWLGNVFIAFLYYAVPFQTVECPIFCTSWIVSLAQRAG
jgi:hypothetical protein